MKVYVEDLCKNNLWTSINLEALQGIFKFIFLPCMILKLKNLCLRYDFKMTKTNFPE